MPVKSPWTQLTNNIWIIALFVSQSQNSGPLSCDMDRAIIQISLVSQVLGDLTGITVTSENYYRLA